MSSRPRRRTTRSPGTATWGGGAFGPQVVISQGAGPTDIISMDTADLDGDGDLDVVYAGSSNNTVVWCRNRGDGTFDRALPITTGALGVSDIQAVDLDGDGDVDILTAGFFNQQLAWHKNLGGGVFGAELPIAVVGGRPMSISAGDFDGDGDVDILLGSFLTTTGLVTFKNLGNGLFGPPASVQGSGHWCTMVTTMDVDGDGDLDTITAEFQPTLGSLVVWYKNESGSPFVSYCPGIGCPCGNDGAGQSGCTNTSGAGATLDAMGTTSASADDMLLRATGLLPGKAAVLFSGTSQVNGGAGNPFGDGLLCVGGLISRLGVRIPDAAGTAAWGPGYASAHSWSAGSTAMFQCWYRDAQGSPCANQVNLSNGLSVTFTP